MKSLIKFISDLTLIQVVVFTWDLLICVIIFTLGKLEREARHLLVDVMNGNETSKELYLQKLNEIDGYDL
jgi:hypothetical protein